jgi:hypothetical protein
MMNKFYEASDNMVAQSKSNNEYAKNVNQLNEIFSERISVMNGCNVDNKPSRKNDDNDAEAEINSNKKRVLLVQKSREDTDSE